MKVNFKVVDKDSDFLQEIDKKELGMLIEMLRDLKNDALEGSMRAYGCKPKNIPASVWNYVDDYPGDKKQYEGELDYEESKAACARALSQYSIHGGELEWNEEKLQAYKTGDVGRTLKNRLTKENYTFVLMTDAATGAVIGVASGNMGHKSNAAAFYASGSTSETLRGEEGCEKHFRLLNFYVPEVYKSSGLDILLLEEVLAAAKEKDLPVVFTTSPAGIAAGEMKFYRETTAALGLGELCHGVHFEGAERGGAELYASAERMRQWTLPEKAAGNWEREASGPRSRWSDGRV